MSTLLTLSLFEFLFTGVAGVDRYKGAIFDTKYYYIVIPARPLQFESYHSQRFVNSLELSRLKIDPKLLKNGDTYISWENPEEISSMRTWPCST